MVFVFCASYLSVRDTIGAVEREKDDFLVITSNSSIATLFSELYTPPQVLLLPDTRITFSTPAEILKTQLRIRRSKKDVLSVLTRLQPSKIIFFFIGFNGFESWILKRLSRLGQVFYRPGVRTTYLRPSFNLRVWIKGAFAGVVYGIVFTPKRFGSYNFLGVSTSFLRLIQARPYRVAADGASVNDLLDRVYPKLPDFQILFLVGAEVNVEADYYKKEMSRIIERLASQLGPGQVAIKAHPLQDTPNLSLGRDCMMLPRYLPASLLLLKCSVVIAYASGTLFEAANSGIRAVSILHLLNPVDGQQASDAEAYLLANARQEISFPETVEELVATVVETLSSESVLQPPSPDRGAP